MRVQFSDDAKADLLEIEAYIAADNPRRALTFIGELRERCRSLSRLPFAFPVVRLRSGVELRRRSYASYNIFYRVKDETVVITRVLHGARDYSRLLGKER